MDIGAHCVTLPHPSKCYSLLAGLRCPRAARHSTAWCKWRALCKWSNIFATSVQGSHATFLFHPSDFFFFPLPTHPPQSPLLDTHIHLIVPQIVDSDSCINILEQNHGCHVPFHDFHSLSQKPTYTRENIISVLKFFSFFLTRALHVLPFFLLFFFCFNSSPNFTSWPCSRAPSPLHTATRASRVGGHAARQNMIAVYFC